PLPRRFWVFLHHSVNPFVSNFIEAFINLSKKVWVLPLGVSHPSHRGWRYRVLWVSRFTKSAQKSVVHPSFFQLSNMFVRNVKLENSGWLIRMSLNSSPPCMADVPLYFLNTINELLNGL